MGVAGLSVCEWNCTQATHIIQHSSVFDLNKEWELKAKISELFCKLSMNENEINEQKLFYLN